MSAGDYRVADISLADFGRKEIELAEYEVRPLSTDPACVAWFCVCYVLACVAWRGEGTKTHSWSGHYRKPTFAVLR